MGDINWFFSVVFSIHPRAQQIVMKYHNNNRAHRHRQLGQPYTVVDCYIIIINSHEHSFEFVAAAIVPIRWMVSFHFISLVRWH